MQLSIKVLLGHYFCLFEYIGEKKKTWQKLEVGGFFSISYCPKWE